MRKEKLEHLMTTGMVEGKHSRGKTTRKIAGWTNKVTECRKNDRCIKNKEG